PPQTLRGRRVGPRTHGERDGDRMVSLTPPTLLRGLLGAGPARSTLPWVRGNPPADAGGSWPLPPGEGRPDRRRDHPLHLPGLSSCSLRSAASTWAQQLLAGIGRCLRSAAAGCGQLLRRSAGSAPVVAGWAGWRRDSSPPMAKVTSTPSSGYHCQATHTSPTT